MPVAIRLPSPRPRKSRGWVIPSSVPLVPINASGGVLSVTSDRKYPKNAAKTNGFGFLARAWCGEHRDLLPRELNGANLSRAFALSLCLSTAMRSALVLPVQAGKIRGSTAGAMWASCPTKFYRHTLRRGGVLPRPPLPSHPHFCRGGRPCPPALPHPLQKPLSLQSRCMHRLWQSVSPSN